MKPPIRALRSANNSLKPLQKRACSTAAPASSTSSPVASSSAPVRLRFAPSPTGFLHLGGLRTALFNHLLARKLKGKWILRIEDTDRTRLVEGAVDSLRDTLEWSGLDYDEGVGRGGSYGPYTQSERLDIYQEFALQLVEQGDAYECFCTPDELQAIRTALLKQGQWHGYDGRCRHLSPEDVARRKQAGQKRVVRFKNGSPVPMPPDLIFGQVEPTTVATGNDDFIILKSDGFPTYHLASVVDDHLMAISHVLRGEEWLPSLPRHHALYRALGWAPPLFAHLPLLANPDGTKLSKRVGDVRVEHYRDQGYEPEALLNFLALMGWDHHASLQPTDSDPNISDTRSDGHSWSEVFTPAQLASAFDLANVTHRKAAVNLSKLDFLNKMTLRRKAGRLGKDGVLMDAGKETKGDDVKEEREELVKRLQQVLKATKVLHASELVDDLDYVGKVFDAELARTVKLNDIASTSVFFFLDPNYDNHEAETILASLNPSVYVDGIRTVMQELEKLDVFTEDGCWGAINATIEQLGLKKKAQLITPMRHALTGRKAGPSIPSILSVLGPDRSFDRLQGGLNYVRAAVRST